MWPVSSKYSLLQNCIREINELKRAEMGRNILLQGSNRAKVCRRVGARTELLLVIALWVSLLYYKYSIELEREFFQVQQHLASVWYYHLTTSSAWWFAFSAAAVHTYMQQQQISLYMYICIVHSNKCVFVLVCNSNRWTTIKARARWVSSSKIWARHRQIER